MVVILILHDRKSSTWYKTKNKTTSCPTHVLVDVYATGSGRRVVDQRINRRLCVQKILVLSVEPRGEVFADVWLQNAPQNDVTKTKTCTLNLSRVLSIEYFESSMESHT